MSVPRTVAEVLREHVTLELEGIDRRYLNVYIPRLQSERGVVGFFRFHRGATFASSALMAPISTAFVAGIEGFVREQGIPLITFKKGQRKDDVAKEHLASFTKEEGILRLRSGPSSARPRRRRRSSGPSGGATRRPDRATPGSCARRPWSTSSISTGWTASSGRSS